MIYFVALSNNKMSALFILEFVSLGLFNHYIWDILVAQKPQSCRLKQTDQPQFKDTSIKWWRDARNTLNQEDSFFND